MATDMDALHARLKEAASVYYSGGESPITDAEYDKGVRMLRAEAERLGDGYDGRWDDLFDTKVDAGVFAAGTDATVRHELPMMSLAKAYERSELEAYMRRLLDAGATGFKLQMKLDGMSMSCVYDGGRLVQMSTRGNGFEGKDASHLIGNPDVDIEHMPTRLADGAGAEDGAGADSNEDSAGGDGKDDGADGFHVPERLEVRGELLITRSHFHEASKARLKATGEAFTAIRNAGIGIVNAAREGLGYHAVLTFVAYRIIVDGRPADTASMQAALSRRGFLFVDDATVGQWRSVDAKNVPSLQVKLASGPADDSADGGEGAAGNARKAVMDGVCSVVSDYGKVRDGFDMPNDGIVIKPLNEDEMNDRMGATAHHPSSQIAFKYAGRQVEVIVRDIEWSVGKQGHLTPTLVYDPVDLNGVRNDRATFHNASYLLDYDIRPGSHALIEQAGGVIPKFDDIVSSPADAVRFTVPTVCPECGGVITMGDRIAECRNAGCPGRKAFTLYAAVGRNALDIEGLGPAVIDAAIGAGMLTDVPSLFELREDQLVSLRLPGGQRVGRNAAVIMREIGNARANAPFDRLVAALAIPGVGMRTARMMERHGISTLSQLQACPHDRLTSIEGIGSVTADAIVAWFAGNAGIVDRLRELGVKAAGVAGEDVGKPEDDGQPESGGGGSHGGTAADGNANEEGTAVNNDPFIDGRSFSITGDVPAPFANRDALRDYIEANNGTFNPTPNRHTEVMIGDESSASSKMRKAKAFRDAGTGIVIMPPDEFAARIA